MKQATIYILLPVHSRKETTRQFVRCLLAQTYKNYRLILIDDGSTDGTAEMVAALLPGAVVIRGRGEWWWAGSLQQGLDWLKASAPDDNDVILFSNDDVAFKPDFLEIGESLVNDGSDQLLLARIHDPSSGTTRESGVHANLRKMDFVMAPSSDDINCLSTRGLFVRWDVARKLGDFYPKALPHYLSDYEWTMRAARHGVRFRTDQRLALEMTNQDRSGYVDLMGVEGLAKYLRLMFSKKSHMNPVYRSSFVILASKWYEMPYRLLRVWALFLKGLYKYVLAR